MYFIVYACYSVDMTYKTDLSSSFSELSNLIAKFVAVAINNNPHNTVGPSLSSYLTALRFLIIAALHKNIPIPYATTAMATKVNPKAALIAISSPKLRRPAAMAPSTMPASYHERRVRSFAKYTFGSTRTGTAMPKDKLW